MKTEQKSAEKKIFCKIGKFSSDETFLWAELQ